MKEIFPGVFIVNQKLATINSVPGSKPFGEILTKVDDIEYRLWDPNRSKAGAAILKEIKIFPIQPGSIVLYLGIAHGFTASYLSDIIGPDGIIYGVEFSERCFNELLPIVERRRNIIPILGDARKPETYKNTVIEKVDVVYCDIAQPDQTDAAMRNCERYLKHGGYIMLTIKSQSIDVTKPAKFIINQEIERLRNHGFEIIDSKMLEPFEERHAMVIARM